VTDADARRDEAKRHDFLPEAPPVCQSVLGDAEKRLVRSS
jgi:hypothetical protein